VKVLKRLKPEHFKAKLDQAGIPLRQGEGLPIALGGAGLTLEELVSLYSALANQGVIKPVRYSLGGGTRSATTTFSPEAIAHTNWALSNITAGSDRMHGSINQKPIAYKTGTGPGGADALAVGTNGHYVVGIWIGTPTGEYLAGNSGLRVAAPILHQVFDLLPPARFHAAKPKQAPESLQYFRTATSRSRFPIQILFPLNGSTITKRAGNPRIPLRIKGVTYPIVVSVNNRTMQILKNNTAHLTLTQSGSYTISVVDTKGFSAKTSFVIN
jgi:penicillin-binding protein 1C